MPHLECSRCAIFEVVEMVRWEGLTEAVWSLWSKSIDVGFFRLTELTSYFLSQPVRGSLGRANQAQPSTRLSRLLWRHLRPPESWP